MPEAPRPLLTVEDLAVDFHTEEGTTQAVRGVSFSVAAGRCLALVGESGSGKSVTAYALMRLVQRPGVITGGRILLHREGVEPLDITALREGDERLYHLRGGLVSMIFQEPMTALSPVHTIGGQIREAICLHEDLSPAAADARAVDVMTRVGIPDPEARLRQYPHEFSGGMRQRVVIAMALVCRPLLLICDEPTTALDVTIQAQILNLVKALQRESGSGVLFITHDIGVVAQVADEVAVMYRGRILEMGTVREILQDPLHPYTRGLLSAIPGRGGNRRRLPTVSDIVGETDITTPYPLRALPGGRRIALPAEAFAALDR